MIFQDREDAGRQLAERLAKYKNENCLVLAIPRGGVPVGYEIARALGAQLDVIVVRKIGAPDNPEFGIGAVGPNGVRTLDKNLMAYLEISEAQLEQTIASERAEVERRIRTYRGTEPLPDVQGRTVILVDDGLATGGTARAAIQVLRQQHPRQLILAVPVASPDTVQSLRSEVDDLVCLLMPEHLSSIGGWYSDFDQLSDTEVLRCLERARKRTDEPAVGMR